MKIRPNTHPYLNKKISSLFGKRRWLIAGILGLGSLIGAVVVFFAVFNYGGFLYQSGQTQYYKQMLKDVSKFDFSFLNNYAEGQLAELDDIKIDMKFKHLMRIQYLREQAIKSDYINPAFKEEEFPAKLTYNGKSHNVKISLTGMMSKTHLGNPAKWSFQVKVRGDDTVEGMKRFGLLVPTARGHLTDWLSEELMKERGLMGLRIDFVTVSVNGKSAGVFYLEERFDKHLIENNRLREGIIFKLEKEVLPYKETKLMQHPDSRAQLLMLKRMWQDVMAGHLPPQQFFDLEKIAKLFVIADLFGNQHPLSKENIRFYFNPVTGLVEPIAREFEDVGKSDPASLKMFLETPRPYSVHFWHRRESIIGLIYNNVDFKLHYIREAAVLCQKEFLDEFFTKKKDAINTIQSKLFRTWPYYKLPSQALYENQRRIRAVIFPDANEITARFIAQEENELSIYLQNLQDLPLEVTHLSWRDSIFCYPEKVIILDIQAANTSLAQPQLCKFIIPPDFPLESNFLRDLKLHYNMLGLQVGEKTVPVFSSRSDRRLNYFRDELIKEANYTSFDFIEEKVNNHTLSISEGAWTVSRDLIIPKNKSLQIAAGARIDLINHAKIISYSPVFCLGKESEPVVINSSDVTGGGLIVIQAGQQSNLVYTVFENLSASKQPDRSMNGVVDFYQSPVNIVSCTFSNNKYGDDFLHITHSDFSIHQTQFKNVYANAFKGENCAGTISHSSFLNINGDALALLSGEVKIYNVFMNKVGKEALSAGENSRIEAQWLDIRYAHIGITAKDQSKITVSDVQILDSKVGIAVFQEKPSFGPAYASLRDVITTQTEIAYLIEKNSSLILEGTPQAAEEEKVKDMLYEHNY